MHTKCVFFSLEKIHSGAKCHLQSYKCSRVIVKQSLGENTCWSNKEEEINDAKMTYGDKKSSQVYILARNNLLEDLLNGNSV